MSDTQEIVEQVDELLKYALEDANTYMEADKVRPSAVRAFNQVEDARVLLDKIDEREFKNGSDIE